MRDTTNRKLLSSSHVPQLSIELIVLKVNA